MFDFESFADDHGIEYRTEGKNCQDGWYNINCVFHLNDHSFHLGYNPAGDYFHCWHCGRHSVIDTLSEVLSIPFYEAAEIKSRYNTFQNKILEALNTDRPNKVELPEKSNLSPKMKTYLENRGYQDIDFLIEKYRLYGCFYDSAYQYRIIIPVFYENEIVSFLSRDYTGEQDLRYKTASKEKELIHHKHLIYNMDNCKEDWIILVEGVFSVWHIGDNCGATFGVSYTPEQVNLIATNYKTVFLLFDMDSAGRKGAEKLTVDLESVGVTCYNLEYGRAEPDDLIEAEKEELFNYIKEVLS